jgi:adenylate cyclase
MKAPLRGDLLQRLRLASGLVLFTFAGTHFLNHAVGLYGLDAMHEVDNWRTAVTRSWPGSIILGAALLTHLSLGLYKLAMRNTLRMPAWEAVQIVLGLSIPFLLFPHIVNTRVAHSVYNVNDIYLYELVRLWPERAFWQSLLLLIVWVHGCIGLHYWLRLSSSYRRIALPLLAVAVALPLAALAGFMVTGRAANVAISDPTVMKNLKELSRWPNPADSAALADIRSAVWYGFGGVLALVIAIYFWRYYRRSSCPKVEIAYVGGPKVRAPIGMTLLEISRDSKIPHASVCGGRARCSTCRVRIEQGLERLTPPSVTEATTLASIEAPKNVRLACQIRPCTPLTVARLLRPATTGPNAVDFLEAQSEGSERIMTVMFLDIRGFTRLTENKLPYDVIFFLNEFFAATVHSIRLHGGWVDKFLGDGLLAVFGQRVGPELGCRQALRAARAIDLAIDHLNAKLEPELGEPLQIGIGIHAGPLVVGRIGHGEAIDMTVIGRTVNAASRLETLTKERGCQIVLSREVARYAGWDPPPDIGGPVTVRGISTPIDPVCVSRGRDLPPKILAALAEEMETSEQAAAAV